MYHNVDELIAEIKGRKKSRLWSFIFKRIWKLSEIHI